MVFDSKQMASKFLDGDLNSTNDLEQLVADQKTKQTFSRYQMISQIMKNEPVAPDVCIADSVMSALSNEATVLAPRTEKTTQTEVNDNVISLPNRFGKQLGGMAIAASVALVALLNFGTSSTKLDSTATVLVSAEVAVPVVDRAQLQQSHQLFTEISQGNVALPVIQTVSNQQAVAITVTVDKAAENKAEPKKNSTSISPEKN